MQPEFQADSPAPPPRRSRRGCIMLVIFAVLGACVIGSVAGYSLIKGLLEAKDDLDQTLNAFMQAMATRDPARAEGYLAPSSDLRLYNTLERTLETADFAMFDHFQNVESKSWNVQVRNGRTSADVSGEVVYSNSYRGTFRATLIKSDGEWKIDTLVVNVPPAKVEDYVMPDADSG